MNGALPAAAAAAAQGGEEGIIDSDKPCKNVWRYW